MHLLGFCTTAPEESALFDTSYILETRTSAATHNAEGRISDPCLAHCAGEPHEFGEGHLLIGPMGCEGSGDPCGVPGAPALLLFFIATPLRTRKLSMLDGSQAAPPPQASHFSPGFLPLA